VAHIQILGSIKRYVDLSVGISSDSIAFSFWENPKKIGLPGDNKKIVDLQPIFG
jgi:hypothetical protein